MLLLCPAVGEAFDGGDLLADGHGGGGDAGADFFAVEEDGAGSALSHAAAELRAVDVEFVKDVKKWRALRQTHLSYLSID
jgi:hypothetical protein